MSMHRLINWLLALAIAAMLSAGCLLDGPSLHSTEQATASSLMDAQNAAAADLRFAHAAAAVCGPNAAAKDLGDGTVQCYTHKGRKTARVAL
jgi:hypothetical protein